MSSVNDIWTTAMMSIGGVAVGASFSIRSTIPVFLGGLVLFAIGLGLALAAAERKKRQRSIEDEIWKQERDEERRRYVKLIDELGTSTFMVAQALHDVTPAKMRQELGIAKKSILMLVRHILGPQGGVRANLFEVRSAEFPFEMAASKWGHDGRTSRSSDRIFKAGDTTFDLAMKGRSRFVDDVDKLPQTEDKGNGYKAFATHPIAVEDDCYGILTVDVAQAHDLDSLSIKLLKYYAGLLTICFVADGDRPTIKREETLLGRVEGETQPGDDEL
ncbi:hypothetical protein ACTRLV_00740 [Corynebacterium durum]|uniref:hypothetical protein n=1 Tax=Corynebacterium durum TaxID=61592 RepID=UPI004041F4D0